MQPLRNAHMVIPLQDQCLALRYTSTVSFGSVIAKDITFLFWGELGFGAGIRHDFRYM